MFEVGFSELLVIFVLALIVLGPEKLPRLAQQVGRWVGRARAMAKQFRDQLEEEVNVAEANKWKPSPQPEPTPATEPPPATSAESDASASPQDPHVAPNPDDTHAAHESHSGAQNGAHNSGPPPEPEASVYEPPAYSSAPGESPAPAAPAETPNGTSSSEQSAASHSHAASDETPLRPGDVVTTTHERGI
jgi:sec-independent protein translocase protein TatB